MSVCCVRCKSVSKLPIFCNSCYQESFKSGERCGRVEELKRLKEEVYFIGKENWLSTDWHEGRKECLKLIEKRLLEMKQSQNHTNL
jgi:predicted amidophosphoribosyltransferase